MDGNERLRLLLDDADCRNAELARFVNAVGEERGLHLTYGKTAVARWLRGVTPHWPVPALVAEALSRKLGYEVGVTDLGWTDRGMATGRVNDGSVLDPSPDTTLRVVTDLARRDGERRSFLRGAAFSVGAFAPPALLATTLSASPVDRPPAGRRIGMADLRMIQETVSHFRRLDQQYGGARLRRQVVRYLHEEAGAALRGSYSGPTGARLLGSVAELACLAGYMTFDAGRHALAQRYYIQALGLAHAAGSEDMVGLAIGCMSFQAVHLGHAREATALARAALGASSRRTLPKLVSMLHSIEARGLALSGDHGGCVRALGRAEQFFGLGQEDCDPGWLRYYSAAEMAHHGAHCWRDLGYPALAQPLAHRAMDGYEDACVRSQGFVRTVLATTFLQQKDVPAACTTATEALSIATALHSARSVDWIRDFNRRLGNQRNHPAAREFHERATAVLATRQ
jgi:hypothetical protein